MVAAAGPAGAGRVGDARTFGARRLRGAPARTGTHRSRRGSPIRERRAARIAGTDFAHGRRCDQCRDLGARDRGGALADVPIRSITDRRPLDVGARGARRGRSPRHMIGSSSQTPGAAASAAAEVTESSSIDRVQPVAARRFMQAPTMSAARGGSSVGRARRFQRRGRVVRVPPAALRNWRPWVDVAADAVSTRQCIGPLSSHAKFRRATHGTGPARLRRMAAK
jgi:hypothetical protein